MRLTKIEIHNFKSIQYLEFDIEKYGNSYTRMLLGINEVGKSNILEAMSYFNTPEKRYDFYIMHNKKNEDEKYVDLYFYMEFENDNTLVNALKKEIGEGKELLKFKIQDINKNVYLAKGENRFKEGIDYKISQIPDNLFIKKGAITKMIDGQNTTIESILIKKRKDEAETFQPLTKEIFEEFFGDKIKEVIETYYPKASFWHPSEEYLISSSINLHEFKEGLSNIPLKNIFILAGYDTNTKIHEAIEKVGDPSSKSKLQSKLQKGVNDYIQKIWKHNINIIIEIDQTGLFTLFVRDTGKRNEHDRHTMRARSDGFKQFISLILSLSVESKKLNRNNMLILIDEPENHLHPSAIRDLGKELLEIGKNNYLFVATHSPFLIDTKNKERNIIIKKNSNAQTEKQEIQDYEDIKDDEVLKEAFGINIYKDLLNNHRLLVEGATDKEILQKAFKIKEYDFGLTNGTGCNIVTVASLLNHHEIEILVVTDDDEEGRTYKNKIVEIGGVYKEGKNVFTIRDIVGKLPAKATIEDCLGKNFVESKLRDCYKSEFKQDMGDFSLKEDSPFIEQVKRFLKEKQDKENVKKFLSSFKKEISQKFKPSKNNLSAQFPLLDSLCEKLKQKIISQNEVH